MHSSWWRLIVALGALACGLVTLALFVDQPNGASGGPSIEFGLAVAAVSPAVAVFGVALVPTARAHDRAVAPELAPDALSQSRNRDRLATFATSSTLSEGRGGNRVPPSGIPTARMTSKTLQDAAAGSPISGPRPPRRVVPIEVRSLGCTLLRWRDQDSRHGTTRT